ncbi:sigma-70 family RNA polymerase sigma factor [Paenarthrobacter histidinolovorans]|uniref:RNA polymerase sigma factor (Sigma-70 family) n=1 Tax=Paenarthrobacter histidinolovorans TaxID=43664 RepID=A0ABW8NAG3_9MICC
MARRSRSSNKSNREVSDDGHLIELVRSGDLSAFDHLYERHVSMASTVAKRNVDNPSDAEDVVAEAFQSVLRSLVAGKGPDTFFRAYLLSTVTRLSHQQNRKSSKVLPSGDESVLDNTMTEPDAAVQAFESNTVARAFRSLPERWQAVLWYLDVERMKPAAVAPILGVSANAVSALAVRAREGLRRQYLQYHLADQSDENCAEFGNKLGYFIRGGLSSGAERKVRGHLQSCAKCTAALAELEDVQGTMRAILLPMITGIPLAAWVGKGAGLGVLGGILPVKGFLAVPALAQPAVMALTTAAAVGLVLGAVGIVDLLSPDASMEPKAVETGAVQVDTRPSPASPTPTAEPTPAMPAPAASSPAEQAPLPETPPVQETVPVPVPSPSTTTARKSPSTSLAAVSGSAKRVTTTTRSGGKSSNVSTWDIAFTASGDRPLGQGKVVLAVENDAPIEARSVVAPAGWSCSGQGSNAVSCVTNSVQRSDLHFRVDAPKDSKGSGILRYSFSGTGLVTGNFACAY